MNTNYIRQAVRESQLEYPSINKDPLQYFNHLFFTNGNGIEFVDGNPVVWVRFNRTVPYTEYYKDQVSFDDLMEYYNERMKECDIEKEFDFLRELYDDMDVLDNDNYWEEAVKNVNEKFNDLILIDDVSDEDLFSSAYFRKLILDKEYIPFLSISPSFYKLDEFNENTETNLLKIGLAISEAYLSVFEEFIADKSLYADLENPICNDFDFEKAFISDVKLLKRNIEFMKKVLSNRNA